MMLCVLSSFYSVSAQNVVTEQDMVGKDTVGLSWHSIKRFSFRTNAFDWFAIIPNFGIEYQLTDSPYKLMTVGLTIKSNWSSYHGTANGKTYKPSAVYDVFDFRPEFRYYYRPTPVSKSRTTRAATINGYNEDIDANREMLAALRKELLNAKDDKAKEELLKSIEAEKRKIAEKDSLKRSLRQSIPDWFTTNIWTTERENARNWRAHYIGGYVNYANYAFKFGERGIRGRNTFGFGAMAGYVLPLYEYNKGAVDIDLGFSVGVQVAKHEVFTHSMDGNYYSKVREGSSWYGTRYSSDKWLPYPVVSELRVAFQWRKSSIKYGVKTNWDAIKAAEKLKGYEKNFYADLEANMSLASYKKGFDESNADMLPKWRKNDSLYREAFVNSILEEGGPKEKMLAFIHTEVYGFTDAQIEKFTKAIAKREEDLINDFDKQLVLARKQAEADAKKAAAQKTDGKPTTEKPVKNKK